MAALSCRKCGSELSIFQSDLCSACRAEQDRHEDHQKRQTHALEMAAVAQEQEAFERMQEIDERRDRAKKKEQVKEEREKKRQQIASVNAIIAAADTIGEQVEAVPDNRGVQLAFLAKLANFFPSTWEGWFLADSLIPHRAEIAYARHRACVVPLLEAVLEARAEFPTSPDRLLRTLATSFLLKDFDAIRRVQRDLPTRLEPIRKRAREVKARSQELEASKRKLQSELREVTTSRLSSFFSSVKGRTREVIESEIQVIDEKVATEKQVFARLEQDCPRAANAFVISRGDPVMRAILDAIDGEVAPLEAEATTTDTEPKDEIGQPSLSPLPEVDNTAPEQAEVEPWFTRLPTVSQIRSWAAAGTIPMPWVVGALVMFFPVGLYFVWRHPQWATKTQAIWTGAWAAAFAVGMWLVAPLLIFLTLLGAFGIALCVIWSSSSLALDKKKLATGLAVGGLLICLFAEIAFFSTVYLVRAYNADNAEQEVKRKKYAAEEVLDKEKARQKEEAVRQKLTEGNQAWGAGDKTKAVALYRECIEMGLSRSGETSTVYQRVIEQDVSAGDLSSAKALMRQARRWGSVELAFTDPKCNELLKEVEVQIVEEKRVEEAKRQEDERRKADEAARKNDKSNPKGDKPSFRGGNKVAEAHAVDFLKKNLKAPATAETQKVEMIDGKNAHYIVHITVDSENSFGARLRGSYLVFVIVTSDTTYNTLPTSIQEVSRTPTKEEIDAFKSINSWELLTK